MGLATRRSLLRREWGAEPSCAYVGLVAIQIATGGLSRQSSASWNPGGTPQKVGELAPNGTKLEPNSQNIDL